MRNHLYKEPTIDYVRTSIDTIVADSRLVIVMATPPGAPADKALRWLIQTVRYNHWQGEVKQTDVMRFGGKSFSEGG
jgi:hypothetical protein